MLPDLIPYQSTEHQPFERGEGPGAALLVHGFPGTPAEMRGIAQALIEDGWHVRAILLPGFGPDIPNLECYTRRDWLRAASQAWDVLRQEYQPLVLIGYSMGGAIAIHLAHDAPPDRMVLAAPFWQYPGLLPELLPLIRLFVPRIHPFRRADFEDPSTIKLFDYILPNADLDDPLVQSTIRKEFAIPLRPLEEIVKLGKEAYRKAAEVKCSTLIIQGEQDVLVTMKKTRELVNHFPNGNARLEIVESTHDLFADCCIQNDRVYRLIERFLDNGRIE